MQLTVPGRVNSRELVASVLLHVCFPPLYPNPEHPPTLRVHDAMVTDKSATMGQDKLLQSVAHLEEGKLARAMLEEADGLLPNPCVYDLTEWLSEHLFAHISMRPDC